jgi:hypothetical protein
VPVTRFSTFSKIIVVLTSLCAQGFEIVDSSQ